MINKSKKKILLASMAFFVSVAAASAQELTLDELKEKINKVNPDAEYAYIIGKYAFTNGWTVETQDVMLASKSTENVGPTDRDSMTIYRVDFDIAADGTKSNLKVGANAVGSGKLELDNEKKINIDYIDYRGINAESLVDVDTLVKNAENKINEKNLFNGTFENGTLTVTILDVEKNFKEGMDSNIFAALNEILKSEGIKSLTLSYNGVEFTYDDKSSLADILAWLNANSQTIFEKAFSDVTGQDLMDKSFDVKITLDDTKLSKNGNPSESYKVNFVAKQESTDKLVQEAIATQNLFDDDKVKFEDGNVEVTIDNLDKTLSEGMGSKLFAALDEIKNNDKVESVEITLNGQTFNSKNNTDAVQWLRDNCQTIFGKSLGEIKESDLIGKEIKAKINLKESVSNTSSTNEYTVNFKSDLTKEKYEEIGKKAIETINNIHKYNIKVNEETKEITVEVEDLATELNVGEVTGTGLKTAMTTYLNDERVKSLKFTVNDMESTEVTTETAEDAATSLYTRLILSLQKEKISYSDLASAGIKVTVNLADGITYNGSDYVEYTLKLTTKADNA